MWHWPPWASPPLALKEIEGIELLALISFSQLYQFWLICQSLPLLSALSSFLKEVNTSKVCWPSSESVAKVPRESLKFYCREISSWWWRNSVWIQRYTLEVSDLGSILRRCSAALGRFLFITATLLAKFLFFTHELNISNYGKEPILILGQHLSFTLTYTIQKNYFLGNSTLHWRICILKHWYSCLLCTTIYLIDYT